MENTIFERFSRNSKWSDYLNFKTFECKISLFITILFISLATTIDVYEKFSNYLETFQNITLNIAQALIGLIGIIIAGVAIVISVFNKNLIVTISELNKESDNPIYKVLISFEFLAFNIGVGIFAFIFIHLCLSSPLYTVPIIPFHVILSIVVYYISFIIFYSISLIGNIIRLFYISHLYSGIQEKKMTLYEQVNEVRIDFILNSILNDSNVPKDEFRDKLVEFVNLSNFENKEELKKYFKEYYR